MKLKREIIGVLAASALVLTPVFANESGRHGVSPQGDSQSQSQQGSAQQGGSAANDPNTVKQVQEALNKHGYNAGTADGQMGQQTQEALQQFQQAQGLAPSGQIDEQTLVVLEIIPMGAGQSGGSSGDPSSSGSSSAGDSGSSSGSSSSGSSSSGDSSSSSSDPSSSSPGGSGSGDK